MDEQIVIREAKREDCKEIRLLIQELADFEKMSDGPKIKDTDLEKDGFDLENPLFYSYVATIDNKVIGYAVYYYIYSTWCGKAMYLEDLYVMTKYQKKGIGKQLIKAVAKKAVQSDCCKLNFAVLNWNPAADFYFKLGARNVTKEEGWNTFLFNRNELEKLCSQ